MKNILIFISVYSSFVISNYFMLDDFSYQFISFTTPLVTSVLIFFGLGKIGLISFSMLFYYLINETPLLPSLIYSFVFPFVSLFTVLMFTKCKNDAVFLFSRRYFYVFGILHPLLMVFVQYLFGAFDTQLSLPTLLLSLFGESVSQLLIAPMIIKLFEFIFERKPLNYDVYMLLTRFFFLTSIVVFSFYILHILNLDFWIIITMAVLIACLIFPMYQNLSSSEVKLIILSIVLLTSKIAIEKINNNAIDIVDYYSFLLFISLFVWFECFSFFITNKNNHLVNRVRSMETSQPYNDFMMLNEDAKKVTNGAIMRLNLERIINIYPDLLDARDQGFYGNIIRFLSNRFNGGTKFYASYHHKSLFVLIENMDLNNKQVMSYFPGELKHLKFDTATGKVDILVDSIIAAEVLENTDCTLLIKFLVSQESKIEVMDSLSIKWIDNPLLVNNYLEKYRYISRSFKDDLFVLYCQCYRKRNTSEKLYFETLVRLSDEFGNIFLPSDFIPVISKLKLTQELDRWVIRNTFSLLGNEVNDWDKIGLCSINISPHTIDSSDFIKYVLEQSEQSNIPLYKICFEIIENEGMCTCKIAIANMITLREYGVKFAIDDFGKGYSNFEYIRKLPFDIVKVDGEYISKITQSAVDRNIVISIVNICKELGILTVAEFVESEEQYEYLLDIGIDYFQGFLFDRPSDMQLRLRHEFQ